MFSHWSIRRKLLVGIALLLITVLALSASSFVGVSAFRSLAKSLRLRAPELSLSSALAQNVSKLNVTHMLYRESLRRHQDSQDELADWQFGSTMSDVSEVSNWAFRLELLTVSRSFKDYSAELAKNRVSDEYRQLQVNEEEQLKVEQFGALLDAIRNETESGFGDINSEGFTEESERLAAISEAEAFGEKLNALEVLANELSGILRESMRSFADEVRGQYRSWMVISGVIGVLALGLLVTLGRLFYVWVFSPLEKLVQGSRRVATGDFEHRIQSDTHDEIAELANAMNGMTLSFLEIRDDLNRKVQERTKEVVRSEQLASVGFLAAGVAHEINNPLASIALCAESLEQRLADDELQADLEDDAQSSVVREYLKMIQDEAFRCKEITERLLDFSRLGDVEKQQTNLTELTQSVIRMIKHLGKYKAKDIEFQAADTVFAPVNAQEIKQVILNLLTNALDSLDPGGKVTVSLRVDARNAILTVRDNGCGMTDEIQKNLFEPFFTRRRDGQGTGLGMSITYRIVNDHGGNIVPHSEGPGKGSTIVVSIPLTNHDEKQSQINQAA